MGTKGATTVAMKLDDGNFYEVERYKTGIERTVGRVTEHPISFVVSISGGDGIDPPGIANDRRDSLTISAELRNPKGHVMPITKTVYVTVRDSDNLVYTIIKMDFVDGVCSKEYKTKLSPGICHIDQKDLAERFQALEISNKVYHFILSGQLEFRVYEDC